MKIAVAMSGGVDSSVVAQMMVNEGHEVIGLFLKLWADPSCSIKRDNRCCDYEALEDARSVAAKLGIPFYVINAEKEFKKEVVDYFLEEYQNLRTPNPCIVCNDKIKFDLLLKKALQLGCEKLCTGHYARIANGNPPPTKVQISQKYEYDGVIPAKAGIQELSTGSQIKSGMTDAGYRLFAGVDELKDQSYMLYRLNQSQLSKVLFPLGEMTKKEVRSLAVKWDLPVKEKPESQEICFVAEKDYREFLKRYLDEKYFKPGDIVDLKGNIIGHHDGLINYTIGQRKGIEQNRGEDRTPLYVVGFDVEKNYLIVGEDQATYMPEMTVGDLSFINTDTQYAIQDTIKVKIRYRHQAVEVKKISKIDGEKYRVLFKKPQRAVTPGQSAVFYQGDQVLGGGIITS